MSIGNSCAMVSAREHTMFTHHSKQLNDKVIKLLAAQMINYDHIKTNMQTECIHTHTKLIDQFYVCDAIWPIKQ